MGSQAQEIENDHDVIAQMTHLYILYQGKGVFIDSLQSDAGKVLK